MIDSPRSSIEKRSAYDASSALETQGLMQQVAAVKIRRTRNVAQPASGFDANEEQRLENIVRMVERKMEGTHRGNKQICISN